MPGGMAAAGTHKVPWLMSISPIAPLKMKSYKEIIAFKSIFASHD